MEKSKKTGAAPVSKYAAKKRALVKDNTVELKKELMETVSKDPQAIDLPKEEVVTEVANASENNDFVADKKNTANKSHYNKKELPPITNRYPSHVVQVALLIKNNAEIRRFTALGILNYLLQKGEIKGNSRYVSFKWNKFAVKCNGLMREFSYNEPFFLNALVASFASFSASAQRTIDNFCKREMSVDINKAVDQEEVDTIVNLNEEYQNSENPLQIDSSASLD